MILPVIMAGGSGSRLWPLSRTLHPKQFLPLINEFTMLQETVKRLDGIDHQDPLFICNQEHRFIVAEQLRKINQKNSGIILEPVGRNTAPAVALASIHAIEKGDDPVLLILAADHVIKDSKSFVSTIKKAKPIAEAGKLITFGVVPTVAETGYGYINRGDQIGDFEAYRVDQFVEKPDLLTAEQYVESGDYLWNSGMFLFKASRFLEELEKYRPDILSACRDSMIGSRRDLDFIRLESNSFVNCPEESIDYAIMEKTRDAIVVPLETQWSDVGSFNALWDVNEKDNLGNSVRGDVLIEQTKRSYIYSQNRLVATVGIDNLVIVETKDAVLVAAKNKVQDVKTIVNQLKDLGRGEFLQHREVYRPWGYHDEIANGNRYQVKHLSVKPGERTATQLHYHRAEHWIVVSGTAKVTNGDDTYILGENESTYIPIGTAHSIENPGKIPLELIEVRSGTYLEEDDVVRLSDYGVGY